jgi:hypothetical protein
LEGLRFVPSLSLPLLCNLGTPSFDRCNEQAATPFLVILRVANWRAITSEELSSGNLSSIQFGSNGESFGGGETIPNDIPTETMNTNVEVLTENTVGSENHYLIEEVPL